MKCKTKPYHLQLDAEAQARFDGGVRLAYKIIHRFVRLYGIDSDDAESCALEHLARAAVLYDSARGTTFSSYGGKSVQNAMLALVELKRRRRLHMRTVPLSVLTQASKDGERLDFDLADLRTLSASEQLEEREQQREVRQMLERIGSTFKPWERYLWETLWAYCVQGRTAREIALQDGISHQGVLFRIKRGIQLIRQRLPGLVADGRSRTEKRRFTLPRSNRPMETNPCVL